MFHYGKLKQNIFLKALCVASLSFIVSSATFAQSADMSASLTKLENKLFQHDYAKDEPAARLERLEKMVFGEARSGSEQERLTSLLTSIPESEETASSSPAQTHQPSHNTAPSSAGQTQTANSEKENPAPVPDKDLPDSGEYPSVSAIEMKVFGKNYAGESINKRLDRLEVKAFGHATTSSDLSDRLDQLKKATGIDIAKQPPPGSDWSDDDEDAGQQPHYSYAQPQEPLVSAPPGEDGRSFSGKDLRRDFQQAFGYSGSGSSGTYGAGGSRSMSSSGMGAGTYGGGMPQPAPDRVASQAPAPAMGLSQQIGLLEKEIFGKSYGNETIPNRLSRLETTVFADSKPSTGMPIPDRVSKLLSAVPLSPSAGGNRVASRAPRTNIDDMDDMGMGSGMPPVAPQRSGLSKVINGLGSFLSGGFVGGYGGSYGNLVSDPQTGLLYDQNSGSLIDPMTGAVVGQRANSMGNYGGFNNGFSPYGPSPYGMGGMGGMGGFGGSRGMGFGFGSGGMGIGTGMWP